MNAAVADLRGIGAAKCLCSVCPLRPACLLPRACLPILMLPAFHGNAISRTACTVVCRFSNCRCIFHVQPHPSCIRKSFYPLIHAPHRHVKCAFIDADLQAPATPQLTGRACA